MGNEDMKNTEKAFRWIIGILRKHEIPFQIIGGLAARVYGSSRELVDIDINIPEGKFGDIVPDVKEFIVYGPERFIGENWDLLFMTLKYENQGIDICSDKAKIRNARTGSWKENHTNFSESEIHEIYGMSVPVIKKESLIEYKKSLSRPVDIEDIEAILK